MPQTVPAAKERVLGFNITGAACLSVPYHQVAGKRKKIKQQGRKRACVSSPNSGHQVARYSQQFDALEMYVTASSLMLSVIPDNAVRSRHVGAPQMLCFVRPIRPSGQYPRTQPAAPQQQHRHTLCLSLVSTGSSCSSANAKGACCRASTCSAVRLPPS